MKTIARSRSGSFLLRCTGAARMSIAVVLAVLAGLAGADDVPAQPHNILLIIADDVGVDMIGAYQPLVGSNSVPRTPTLDGLAAQGILFRNAWANPYCAATRAALQTGRYGFRTGIKGPIGALSVNEFSIGKMLHSDPANNHALALFGKWGLSGTGANPHPVQMGYDSYKGILAAQLAANEDYFNYHENSISFNAGGDCDQHVPASYLNSTCISPPVVSSVQTYATTKNADDTIAWINGIHNESGGTKPWFVTLAFIAAHTPLNAPPPALIQAADCAALTTSNQKSCYRAMIEAMDSEIKRVLDNIPPAELSRTTIIFMGDNGSAEGMAVPPFIGSRSKSSLYEGGVNVPLIIAGSDVVAKPRVSKALVNISDLFMTILDIAGFDRSNLPTTLANGQPWLHDSRSLLPILQDPCTGGCQIQTMRQFAYSEVNYIINLGYTVRDFFGYKLMYIGYGPTAHWEFYNLTVDPFEQHNLVSSATGSLLAGSSDVNAAAALAKLRTLLPGNSPLTPTILAVNQESPTAHTGDINNDGKIDVADVLLASQHLIKARALTATEVLRGDVYPQRAGDGELNISDLLLIQKAALSH